MVDTIQILNNIYGQAQQAMTMINSNNVQQQKRGKDFIQDIVRNLGQLIQQLRQQKNKLANLADKLDAMGAHASADILDIASLRLKKNNQSIEEAFIQTANELDENGEHIVADIVDFAFKIAKSHKNEEKMSIKPRALTPLSSRYCPDHIGVQMIRIGENTYQCPLDGKEYDYQSGFINYKGEQVLGGSVTMQTPDSTPFAVPCRVFDSRVNIINNKYF